MGAELRLPLTQKLAQALLAKIVRFVVCGIFESRRDTLVVSCRTTGITTGSVNCVSVVVREQFRFGCDGRHNR